MNAKEEFLGEIEGKEVKCVYVIKDYASLAKLKVGYTKSDMKTFLSMLDFEYNNGYGGQYLYGCIWYVDGTWSDRGEYDGSEWWEYRYCLPVPKALQ